MEGFIKAANGNYYPAGLFSNPENSGMLYGNGFFKDPENVAALGAGLGTVAATAVDIANRAKEAKNNKAKGIGGSFFDRTAAANMGKGTTAEATTAAPSFMGKYGMYIIAGVVVIAVVYFFVIKKK